MALRLDAAQAQAAIASWRIEFIEINAVAGFARITARGLDAAGNALSDTVMATLGGAEFDAFWTTGGAAGPRGRWHAALAQALGVTGTVV